MTEPRPRLFLIDGHALIYRAFFAMIQRPLTTSRGENTSAAWGIANFLIRLFAEHRPDYVAWILDQGDSFRHRVYPDYKATRQKLDETLQQDFDRSLHRVSQLLAAWRVKVIAVDGYEADDVIGTLAAQAASQGVETVIVSGDKDFHQLVGTNVLLLNPGRRGPAAVEEHWVDRSNAEERLGVPPERVADYLALVGDASDNVPGVRGVGEKTARALIERFGNLETILARTDEVTPSRVQEALRTHGQEARLSKALVTIRRDLPVTLDLPALAVRPPDHDQLLKLFGELEFHSLVPRAQPPTPAAATSGIAEVVQDVERIGAVVEAVRRAPIVALSVETTSDDPMGADLVGLALATAPERAWYFPLGHRASGELLEGEAPRNLPPLTDAALRELAALLRDPAVAKAAHDLKRAWLLLRDAGVELAGARYDSLLASFVLDPGRRSHGLEALALERFGEQMRHAAIGGERPTASPAERSVADAAARAAEENGMILRLKAAFEPELAQYGLARLLEEIEIPLVPVLVDMEWRGIGIDRAWFAGLRERFGVELTRIERRIYHAAGIEFNINSTPQLRHVLFEKLMLPVVKKTKTGPSTDADVLDQLAALGHEVPQLILEYRELAKLKSTYVDVLPTRVNPRTGRIHTRFNQAGAATGRLSSAEPNLQNIPIRTPRGELIRRGFVAADGHVFLAADYSQIELRLLAHLSGDRAFIEAFARGGDIHRQTASAIFGVPPEQVTPEMRGRAKTINFATIYGQGPFALARQLSISQDEARRFIQEYFVRFAGVRTWLDRTIAEARERGYVETIFGRRRYIPELKDLSFSVRAFGERTATNSPLQGSAADLIKVAMIRIHRALGEQGLPAWILLQVHDELVLEVEAGVVDKVLRVVQNQMESVVSLRVPLVVNVGVASNWLNAKA